MKFGTGWKRILPAILAAALVITNLPVQALAAESEAEQTADIGINEEGTETLTSDEDGRTEAGRTIEFLTDEEAEDLFFDPGEGEEEDGEPEWPATDYYWWKDYNHQFVYVPKNKDLNENEIEEEYQLWIYSYSPRDEHKNDEYLLIPAFTGHQHVDGSPIFDLDSNGEPIGGGHMQYGDVSFRTVLSSRYYRSNEKISLWDNAKDVIKGIKIEKYTMVMGDCSYLFSNLPNLEVLECNGLYTRNVSNMSHMFYNDPKLKELDFTNIELTDHIWRPVDSSGCLIDNVRHHYSWDTSCVTNMDYMFAECRALKKLNLGDYFKTPKVSHMTCMFDFCESLEELDFSGVDTSSMTDMTQLFYRMFKLKKLSLGEKFDTSKVTKMTEMFRFCEKLETLDISMFDTSLVTDMDYMFYGCEALKTLKLGNDFTTAAVTNMKGMFMDCEALETIDLTHFDTGNVTDMASMFSGCESMTTINVGNFDTSKVTDMGGMFSGCESMTTINVGNFDTSKVTDMGGMFSRCSSLTSVDISNFDTSQVTSIGYMFSGCSSLTEVDLSGGFTTGALTGMYGLFDECESLKKVTFGNGFNTTNVTEMGGMFKKCPELTQIDLSMFNTAKVTNMDYMFSGCTKLKTLDLTGFRTASLESMDHMFDGCESLTELDLRSFDWSQMEDGDYDYFINGSGIVILYLPTVTAKSYDFYGSYYDSTDYKRCLRRIFYTGTEEQWAALNNSCGTVDNYTNYVVVKCSCGNGTTDSLKWPAAANDWYTAYDYTLDGNMIWLKGAKAASLTGYVTVPATATINGKNYTTGLYRIGYGAEGYYNQPESIWYSCRDDLRGLKIEPGVKVGESGDRLFSGLNRLEILDVSGLDTSGTTDMRYMFGGFYDRGISFLDLSGLDTSHVTDMSLMFNGDRNLRKLDLSGFDTSNVTTMRYMFSDNENLNTLVFGTGFKTDKVTDFSFMFDGLKKIRALDVTGFNTGAATDMSYMFHGVREDQYGDDFIIDVSGFNTSNVKTMAYMFSRCKSKVLNVSNFNTSKVTTMEYMFEMAGPSTVDVTDFDTSEVTDMGSMFYCMGLKSIDVSNFNTSKVTDFGSMFSCNDDLTVLDVSNFDTSKAYSMESMFCRIGVSSLDLTGFVTSGVRDMTYMFAGCENLATINLQSFDFTAVNNAYTENWGNKAYKIISSINWAGNAGCVDLYLPVKAMSGFDFTPENEMCGDDKLKRIHYAGTAEQWAALNNTVPEGITVTYGETYTGPVPVTGVSFEKKTATVKVGKTITLTPKISPAKADNKKVTFVSSLESVATVDNNGVVTGVTPGVTDITVTTDDGGFSDTCRVTVPEKVNASGVAFDKKEYSVYAGSQTALKWSISPADADDTGVTFVSDKEEVAKVSASGIVSGIAVGEANITIKTNDGDHTDTCKVTVSEKPADEQGGDNPDDQGDQKDPDPKPAVVKVTALSLNKTKLTLKEGASETLTAAVTPDNAGNKNVIWSVTNADKKITDTIATVAGGTVTAVTAGEAVVTATSEDGGFTASCEVLVVSENLSDEQIGKIVEEEYSPGYIPDDEGKKEDDKPTAKTPTVTVNGETIEVPVPVTYRTAVTYTGKNIKPENLEADLDTSAIIKDLTLKEGAAITDPEKLISVKFVLKSNKNAGKKATFYAQIKIDKKAKKSLSEDDYKILKSKVDAANKELKKKANQRKFTINKRSVTDGVLEVTVTKKNGAIKLKKGKVAKVKSIKLVTDEVDEKGEPLVIKLSADNYKIEVIDAVSGLVKVTGKKNFTGTTTVYVK